MCRTLSDMQGHSLSFGSVLFTEQQLVTRISSNTKAKALLDAALLLTIGSFLLAVELFYLQLTILAFLLTIGAFWLTI